MNWRGIIYVFVVFSMLAVSYSVGYSDGIDEGIVVTEKVGDHCMRILEEVGDRLQRMIDDG